LSLVRYAIGNLSLPFFTELVLEKFDVDLNAGKIVDPEPKQDNFPSPIVDAGTVQFHS
jgi:hypothetical protein